MSHTHTHTCLNMLNIQVQHWSKLELANSRGREKIFNKFLYIKLTFPDLHAFSSTLCHTHRVGNVSNISCAGMDWEA